MKDNLDSLNKEAQAIWDRNAEFWDDRMGEGNQFQRLLVGPASERLLAIKPGEQVLEIACGTGIMARHLAALGAHIVATDFSEQMLEKARARTREYVDRIEYRHMDATDGAQLFALGESRFDAGICNMAFMDMARIEPLLSALTRLLKAEGRFVFSITHPCFNTSGISRVVEEEDREGQIVTTYAIKVLRYLSLGVERGLGIIGQPVPQLYFNRTLSDLFNTCFHAGFIMDALEEPPLDAQGEQNRPMAWGNFREIPPVLLARLRPARR